MDDAGCDALDGCDHAETRLTRHVFSNGSVHYPEQCLRCGASVRTRQKKTLTAREMAEAPPLDTGLRDRWFAAEREKLAEQRGLERAEWREWYDNVYLLSPDWRSLRLKVLRRDRFICQGCGEARATQVHHLTYQRIGREMLFDLVAVCDDCHAAIHAVSVAD